MVKILEFNKYDENENVEVVKIPVSVTMSAIMKFERYTGKSIAAISDNLEDAFILLYYSYLAGVKLSKHKGYKVKYDNLEDFEEAFDGVGSEFVKVIPDFFPDTKKK